MVLVLVIQMFTSVQQKVPVNVIQEIVHILVDVINATHKRLVLATLVILIIIVAPGFPVFVMVVIPKIVLVLEILDVVATRIQIVVV